MANQELTRAVGGAIYFLSGCLVINVSQALGAPLYLINRDWYNAWIAFTKQSFGLLTMTLTQCWAPTIVRVSGDKSVRGQILQTVDGNVFCDFPERLILMANHQIYTDWLYLWWIAYTAGMHGRIYIVLKESLRRIPVIGWGMQLSQFIFLKRNWEKDKPHLAAHLQKLNKAFEPMWLLMFPEGTNLAPCTRAASQKYAEKMGLQDMRHQLLPRSTGLQFCLQELRTTVDYVYDCTIAYEGVPRGQYAQDIFTLQAAYFAGRPPKSVNMYWRRFAVSSIPLDDSRAFEIWLRARWTEKDQLLDLYLRTGHFPADAGVDKTPEGKTRRGAGYIETEIRPFHWYEFLQIFAPMGLLALVLYTFYGALPRQFLKSINKEAVRAKIESIQRNLIQRPETKLLMNSKANAVSNELTALKKTATIRKIPVKKRPIRKVPPKAITAKQASIVRVPNQQTHLNVAKKQQQTSATFEKAKTKQEPRPTPKKLDIKQNVKLTPKKLGPKKLEAQKETLSTSEKPELKHKTIPTSKKLDMKQEVNSAPKKLDVKKLEPKELERKKTEGKHQASLPPNKLGIKKLEVKPDAQSTPKKLDNNVRAKAKTRQAPTSLETRPKVKASPKKLETKQNTRQVSNT